MMLIGFIDGLLLSPLIIHTLSDSLLQNPHSSMVLAGSLNAISLFSTVVLDNAIIQVQGNARKVAPRADSEETEPFNPTKQSPSSKPARPSPDSRLATSISDS
jgi:hypothetical protein